jgi:hypothetical protein
VSEAHDRKEGIPDPRLSRPQRLPTPTATNPRFSDRNAPSKTVEIPSIAQILLETLSRIARALSSEVPGIEDKFRVPRTDNDQREKLMMSSKGSGGGGMNFNAKDAKVFAKNAKKNSSAYLCGHLRVLCVSMSSALR